ncbi:hypothetical protein BTM501_08620 [Helicobacter pylori]
MSEPLETLDKDKKAMSEAIKKDIEKDKENLARVEADEDEKGYEKDDDTKAQKLDKEIAKDKKALTMISFMKRTIELNETKKETMPSVIKKKQKMTHAW